jgi:hypothetical protein
MVLARYPLIKISLKEKSNLQYNLQELFLNDGYTVSKKEHGMDRDFWDMTRTCTKGFFKKSGLL